MEQDAIGLAPIPGDLPAGNDVRDSDEFNALQDEFAKQFDPQSDVRLNPSNVVNLATVLLTTQGKDLLVGCYLVSGLMRQNGLQGLDQGLINLLSMVEAYWDTMFPPVARLRARRNAVEWLRSEVTNYLTSTEFEPQPAALAESLKKNLRQLDAALSAKDADSPPLMSVMAFLERIPCIAEVVVEEAAPVAEDGVSENSASNTSTEATTDLGGEGATPSASPASSSSSSPIKIATVTVGDEPLKALTQINQGLTEVASVILGGDILNPLSYRLVRMAAWDSLLELPPAVNGRTRIAPPMPHLRTLFIGMETGQPAKERIVFSEAQISTAWFWLDLHRLSVESLKSLGGSVQAACLEIELAVSNLLARFPELPSYTFNDGSPFADSQTQAWLSSLSSGSGGGSGTHSSASMSPSGGGVDFAKLYDEARQESSAGNWSSALKLMQTRVDQAGSVRNSFIARIELCDLVLLKQPPINATPFAQSLLDIVEHYHLSDWEPDLALKGLQTAYSACTRQVDSIDQANKILLKISHINGGAAFNLVNQN